MSKPKIFSFDIETAPLKGHFWGQWKQNISYGQISDEWYMLSWAGKWLGKPKVLGKSLADYPEVFKANIEDDSAILGALWELLDEADIVVAHNGKKFDVKKTNARFIKHGFGPPSPYKVVDTLLAARKYAAFTSNRLDSLGEHLKLGRKVETGGFELWLKCMQGNKKAFKDMLKYNKQDVLLLEEVYLTLRPWMDNHPSVSVHDETCLDQQCTACGSTDLRSADYHFTNTMKYDRFQCNDCGHWDRSRLNVSSTSKKANTLVACPSG